MNVTHFKVQINCEKPMGSKIDQLESWLFSVTGKDRNNDSRQVFSLKEIEKIDKRVRKGKAYKWTDGYTRIIITPMNGLSD
jgi:hypothetical protein